MNIYIVRDFKMTETEIDQLIVDSLKERSSMAKGEIVDLINKKYPNVNDASITWKLHKLKSQGLIHSPGYGIYSYRVKENVQWGISTSLKRYYNKVKKEFPYLQICVWDSRWFNSMMLHQPFKYYLVIEVEKDAAESVFNTMTDFSKKVFLNPTEEIFNRYISNFNEAIIIKPLITEAPLLEQDGITLASFEKLLVDCIADKDLFAAQQDELEFIYKTAFSKYNINVNKLKRYARRRSQLEKLNELLYKTTAK